VGENLRLALPGTVRSYEAAKAIEASLAMVQLPTDLSRAMPRELSGGMAQRVGVARALLRKPRLMLMDEPFAALDTITRTHLQDMLRTLMGESHCLFVTHDISEAFRVAERICIMHEGRIARLFEAPEFATQEQRRALRMLIVEQLGLKDRERRED
jgi:ABC-type proline/glycine betaine transport system ATPase subunit